MEKQLHPIQLGFLKAIEDMLHNIDFLVSALVRAKFTIIFHVIKCKNQGRKELQEISKQVKSVLVEQ